MVSWRDRPPRELGELVPMVGEALASDLDEALPQWLVDRLTELAIVLPIGLLLLLLIPTTVKRPAESLRRKPLAAFGYGLLGVLIAINVTAIAIFIFFLILMFGIWLGTVISWDLAFIVWGVVYSALALAFALFSLAVFHGSKVVVADLAGTLFFERVAPKANSYRVLPFLLGLILYLVVRSIPTVGLIFEIIIIILGLGGVWMALLKRGWETTPAKSENEEI